MKRTASVERASRSSVSSRRGKQANSRATYVMCVDNESNPESLELRKIYRYFIRVALPRTLPRTARKVLA